jgi:hypothetical protein
MDTVSPDASIYVAISMSMSTVTFRHRQLQSTLPFFDAFSGTSPPGVSLIWADEEFAVRRFTRGSAVGPSPFKLACKQEEARREPGDATKRPEAAGEEGLARLAARWRRFSRPVQWHPLGITLPLVGPRPQAVGGSSINNEGRGLRRPRTLLERRVQSTRLTQIPVH